MDTFHFQPDNMNFQMKLKRQLGRNRRKSINPKCAQGGVVLLTALVILLTLTIVALALVRLSVVELKVAGSSQRYQVLFNDAEAIINEYFFSNQEEFVSGCLRNGMIGNNIAFPTARSTDECRFIEGRTNAGNIVALGTHSIRIPNIAMEFSRVELQVEQMSCIDRYYSQVNSGQATDDTASAAVIFDIRSRAWDVIDSDSSVTIHSGIVAALPPGDSCQASGRGQG